MDEALERTTSLSTVSWISMCGNTLPTVGLRARGSGGGVVPNLFGRLRNFDPKLHRPHLDSFIGDKYLPSALFLQYFPQMEMVHLHNFSEERMDNLIMGIQAIHQALVEHGDPKLRNMMVIKDDPSRVMWTVQKPIMNVPSQIGNGVCWLRGKR